MKKDIHMPKLSAEMKTGLLASWNVKENDSFKQGDILFEVETEKVVSEVEATEDGKMHQILAEAGDQVEVGAKIGVMICE